MVVAGSIVRLDVFDADVSLVHPDDVEVCPSCGGLCDTLNAMDCRPVHVASPIEREPRLGG